MPFSVIICDYLKPGNPELQREELAYVSGTSVMEAVKTAEAMTACLEGWVETFPPENREILSPRFGHCPIGGIDLAPLKLVAGLNEFLDMNKGFLDKLGWGHLQADFSAMCEIPG